MCTKISALIRLREHVIMVTSSGDYVVWNSLKGVIICMPLFLGMEAISKKHALKGFVFVCLYGIMFWSFFSLYIPIFIASVLALIKCKLIEKKI